MPKEKHDYGNYKMSSDPNCLKYTIQYSNIAKTIMFSSLIVKCHSKFSKMDDVAPVNGMMLKTLDFCDLGKGSIYGQGQS